MLETSGACNEALTTLDSDVAAYVSAAQTLDDQAKKGQVPSDSDATAAQNALTQAQIVQGRDVEPACKPE